MAKRKEEQKDKQRYIKHTYKTKTGGVNVFSSCLSLQGFRMIMFQMMFSLIDIVSLVIYFFFFKADCDVV